MLTGMSDRLRIVIASYGPAQFQFLHETLAEATTVSVLSAPMARCG